MPHTDVGHIEVLQGSVGPLNVPGIDGEARLRSERA